MALKLYTSVAKGLKLKVRKFQGLIPTSVEVTGEKLEREALYHAVEYLECLLDAIFFRVNENETDEIYTDEINLCTQD